MRGTCQDQENSPAEVARMVDLAATNIAMSICILRRVHSHDSCPCSDEVVHTQRVLSQRRYDTHHEMLTQRVFFCIDSNTKKDTLSQQFVTHVAPPLVLSRVPHTHAQISVC